MCIRDRYRVMFVEGATPATLTAFKDLVANTLLSVLDSWSIDFKTFRCQIKTPDLPISKLMYSVTLSHHEKQTVLIKDNGLAVITSSGGSISGEDTDGTLESFDSLINTKLSNIWNQRQSIKGTAGETFLTMKGFIVRVVNLFSSTGFKGLLVECEEYRSHKTPDDANDDSFEQGIQTVQQLLESLDAVSYTHLDVYKRQMQQTGNSKGRTFIYYHSTQL